MTKLKKEANLFFSKNKENIGLDVIEKINSNAKNSFSTNGIALTNSEQQQIKHIVLSATNSDILDEQGLSFFENLKQLTSQIKGIQKQGILLIGESIFKAREIINQITSSQTTFSDWIGITFKTKSSAYNALAYYEFHRKLPTEEIKGIFQSIPYKAAYILSSRKVDFDKKCKVLGNLKGLSNSEALSFIDKIFPKKRKNTEPFLRDRCLVDVILNKMSYLANLLSTFSSLNDEQKLKLSEIINLLTFVR